MSASAVLMKNSCFCPTNPAKVILEPSLGVFLHLIGLVSCSSCNGPFYHLKLRSIKVDYDQLGKN